MAGGSAWCSEGWAQGPIQGLPQSHQLLAPWHGPRPRPAKGVGRTHPVEQTWQVKCDTTVETSQRGRAAHTTLTHHRRHGQTRTRQTQMLGKCANMQNSRKIFWQTNLTRRCRMINLHAKARWFFWVWNFLEVKHCFQQGAYTQKQTWTVTQDKVYIKWGL